jgi:hypothetical protein
MSDSIEREPRTNGLEAPDRRPAGPVEVSATRNLAPPGVVAAEPPPPQAAKPADEPRAKRPRVTVEVVRGSLTQANDPVAVVGRYQGLPLAGPAREFDKILKSWITRALELKMIGSGLGKLFLLPMNRHRKAGEAREAKADELLVVGMGEPGCFAVDDLHFLMTNVTVAIKAMGKERFGVSLIGKSLELRVADKGKLPDLKIKVEEDTEDDVNPEETRLTLLRVTCPSPHRPGAADPAGPGGPSPPPGADDAPPAVPGELAVFRYSALSQTSTIPYATSTRTPTSPASCPSA